MTVQYLLIIESASLGFIASIFFIFGSVTMSPNSINAISGTYWGYNKHIAKALSSQRAEYISGSLTLCLAFLLQVCSALLPQHILELNLFAYKTSIYLFLLMLLGTLLLSLRFRAYIARRTEQQVQLIHKEAEEEYQRQKSLLVSNEKKPNKKINPTAKGAAAYLKR